MTKLRPSHSLLFLLITTFLTMQWSTTHIHLADHHSYGGSHHQHAAKSHSHHTIAPHVVNHHSDVIDTAHSDHNTTVVKLDHDCNSPCGKIKTPGHAAITTIHWQAIQPLAQQSDHPHFSNLKPAYLDQSTIQLRAPPLHS